MPGIQIEGARTGRVWDITLRNMGRILGINLSAQHYTTQRDALAFTLQTTQTPAGPADYFFYVRNSSADRDLIITRIQADAATAETIEAQYVTGTPVGGTSAGSPLSRNAGIGNTFQGVVEGGADITGLTDSGTFEKLFVPAGGEDEVNLLDRPIILPRGQATNIGVALLATTGGITVNALMDVIIQTYDPAEGP